MIRKATLSDLPRIVEIYNHRLDHSATQISKYTKDGFQKYIEAPQSILLVYELCGVVVGYILAYDLVDWCMVETIVVDRLFRQAGCGSALLLHLVYMNKWDVIELCYFESDKVMERLLGRCGFISSNQKCSWMYRPTSSKEEMEA